MRRLRVSSDVATLIRGLYPVIKRKVRAALDEILEDPAVGKALKGHLGGLRGFRVGRIRIIYRTRSRGPIEIVAVGARSITYEATLRLLEKAHHGND